MDGLKRKRGSLKAKLTSFTKFLKNITDKTLLNPEEKLSEREILEIEARLNNNVNLLTEFEAIQDQIEFGVDENSLQGEYLERENFEEIYHNQNSIAKEILNKYIQSNVVVKSDASCNQQTSSTAIKLKPIEIPKFEGSYHNWLEFADLFESLINKNESLDNIQRFHYLRASLEGGAAQVIRSLEFTSDNYSVAWSLLRSRYDNKRLLISNHVKSLFNIECINRESSHKLRQLIDTVLKNLHSLNQLEQKSDTWDVLLIHIISTKLDSSTLREWEKCKGKNEIPTFDDMKTFLKSRADYLETIEMNQTDKKQHTYSHSHSNTHASSYVRNSQNTRSFHLYTPVCVVCNKEHNIYNCTDFMNLPPEKKFEKARSLNLCTNCLKRGHFYQKCRQTTCKKCSSKHHTLLHPENKATNIDIKQSHTSDESKSEQVTSSLVLANFNENKHVLLSTALINVSDINNKIHTVRALLDCGSQSSFISARLCDLLKIEKHKTNISVSGINNTSSNMQYKCKIRILSPINAYGHEINCFILPEIAGFIPDIPVNISELNIPTHLKLADPSFHEPRKIDILIGNDVFWSILCQQRYSLGKNKPVLQKTVFGWIVAGPYLSQNISSSVSCNLVTNLQIQEDLRKFWELEEIFNCEQPVLSNEEKSCEEHFRENTYRDDTGRFVVSFPFKAPVESLGDSFESAKGRFLNLERKLNRNSKLKNLYCDFIEEYIALGHMKKVGRADDFQNQPDSSKYKSYFMPHHGVLRENAITTRLRVVFDCSMPTSNGISLNNIQMNGPSLQSDLISILLRFRSHTYVVSGDIEKMYRQVVVRDDQTHLQRILWRKNPNDPLEIFDMKRVTYGMKCASYLAIKCLHTLGVEHEKINEKIAKIIKSDFYVDDLLTGFDSKEEASNACKEISKVLGAGGFPIRKFYSNDPTLLENLEPNSSFAHIIEFGENEKAKTLGLSWAPYSDVLLYNIPSFIHTEKITKRCMLSDTSQIFDPLGLISPCVIVAKIMLQRLWLERLSWDDFVPLQIQNSYIKFREQLPILNNLNIQRHVKVKGAITLELHGFSDASEYAFGSSIYIKSTDENHESFCHLLCAKSKVSPIKAVTIPKLELCGAVLLSRLARKVLDSLDLHFDGCYLWSDSSIVLSWLKSPCNSLKPFVCNRVSEIQENTNFAQWRHVPGKDNPADLLSRGVTPDHLVNSDLWWHGPSWILQDRDKWPNLEFSNIDVPEVRKNIKTFIVKQTSQNLISFEKFSNFIRLKRCVAYVFRFINNCKVNCDRRSFESLSVQELDHSHKYIIKLAQQDDFSSEINIISKNKVLEKHSKIVNLNPFLDSDGLLRVGGRLENSEFSYAKKHPVILSSKHAVTKLIFEYFHKNLMHPGPQHLLANIREEYWPLRGRQLARSVVHKCIRCFRLRPKLLQPLMGNLPAQRLALNPPFFVSGVDYAGPIFIKDRKGRGYKLLKCYICIFVCFSTKAAHIELVTDLSKDLFLLALKRFIARRGKPKNIISDNGSNFIAANSDINDINKFLSTNASYLADSLSKDNITWTFSPPYSPHFGGLWEAGVKTIKHHMRRVLANALLTYEEFNSVLVQIEAILNSRPLFPLSNDPDDLSPLTPAHFLVGRPLTTTPDPDYLSTPMNRLTRYELVQKLLQHLWSRWSKEYVSELQKRTKWTQSSGDVNHNSLVLIKENKLPPMKWKLGRVVEMIRGRDGIARVFKIKTSNGVISRSFARICPLPLVNENDSELDTVSS